MKNHNVEIAWKYHDATKHSYWSIRQNAHYLDWLNQPMPFKLYPRLEPIPLPRDFPPADIPTLDAVSEVIDASREEVIPGLPLLAHVLFFSAGVTKTKTYPGGEIYFRAAACAGALYPVEVYVVCRDLPGLDAGVYHFSPADFTLRRLRAGDWRPVLAKATGGEPGIASAPVILVHTAITWRSSWKYQARSYRYHFWDDGMILANTLAAAAAQKIPVDVVMGFVDETVNRLVGVDGEREMSLSLVPLGRAASPDPPAPVDLPALTLDVEPLSHREVDYPIIRQMHAASNLMDAGEVSAWRRGPAIATGQPVAGRIFKLQPLKDELPGEGLESVILRRASTRRFSRQAISFEDFSTLLERATRGYPADYLGKEGKRLTDLYINVHAVDGLPPGAYFYRWEDRTLELLAEGEFRDKSRYLCLEQDLGGDSSATVFFMADLGAILQQYGNRGYRAAQMESGILGGKLYLAAYALGRGATGLTFYDDEATEFFSPHASGKSAVFVIALGVPGRRPQF